MSRSVAALAAVIALTGCLLAGCASKSVPKSAAASSPGGGGASAPSTVSFDGVAVQGASSLAAKPNITAHSSSAPPSLEVKDLVVGTGTPASPTSTVTVQYVGVRYADGKQFDASWDHGGATSFSLRQVVRGFTEGIGGTSGIAPMKVGGRRLMILPAALGYGAAGTPDGSIPPNAAIVFVVDLVGVS